VSDDDITSVSEVHLRAQGFSSSSFTRFPPQLQLLNPFKVMNTNSSVPVTRRDPSWRFNNPAFYNTSQGIAVEDG
jgi:hypothetical protein